MIGPLVHLDALERLLVARGFPAMAEWWRLTLTAFYSSGRRQLVLRCGRRGGKSSTLCRVAVLEALYGEHVIPPGDLGVVAIISVSRDEASQRLRTVKAILDALGVKWHPIDGGIELDGRPIAFKVYAASVAGVSGFTCICAIADEVAKWKDADTGANPATEVLASLRPTMATQPRARIFLSSSPMGMLDAHALAFEAGETTLQLVAYAPTWTANPTITEADTHALEPDDRKWRREYLAIPQASQLAAFDSMLVDRAIGAAVPMGYERSGRVMLLDPTAGASDCYAFGAVGWCRGPAGAARLEFIGVNGVDNATSRGFTSDRMVGEIASRARSYWCSTIHADQFERFALASAFQNQGFRYVVHNWTAPMKERAVEHVRGWLMNGVLCLPAHERMKRELHAFEERIAPSGALTFRGRQGSHDDFAMLVLLAALVDVEGGLPGSPLFDAHEAAAEARATELHAKMVQLGYAPDEGLPSKAWDAIARGNRGAVGAVGIMATAGKASAEDDDNRPGLKKRDRIPYNRELLRQGSSILTARDLDELIEAGLITSERKQQYLDDLQVMKGRRSPC